MRGLKTVLVRGNTPINKHILSGQTTRAFDIFLFLCKQSIVFVLGRPLSNRQPNVLSTHFLVWLHISLHVLLVPEQSILFRSFCISNPAGKWIPHHLVCWYFYPTAGLDPQCTHTKNQLPKKKRATMIPRPLLESSWRGKSKFALTIFVKK